MWDIIAGMEGLSGFPAGQYCNELEKNDETGELRIHVMDQEWIDYMNSDGHIEYEMKEIDRYEAVTGEEANVLLWDWHD